MATFLICFVTLVILGDALSDHKCQRAKCDSAAELKSGRWMTNKLEGVSSGNEVIHIYNNKSTVKAIWEEGVGIAEEKEHYWIFHLHKFTAEFTVGLSTKAAFSNGSPHLIFFHSGIPRLSKSSLRNGNAGPQLELGNALGMKVSFINGKASVQFDYNGKLYGSRMMIPIAKVLNTYPALTFAGPVSIECYKSDTSASKFSVHSRFAILKKDFEGTWEFDDTNEQPFCHVEVAYDFKCQAQNAFRGKLTGDGKQWSTRVLFRNKTKNSNRAVRIMEENLVGMFKSLESMKLVKSDTIILKSADTSSSEWKRESKFGKKDFRGSWLLINKNNAMSDQGEKIDYVDVRCKFYNKVYSVTIHADSITRTKLLPGKLFRTPRNISNDVVAEPLSDVHQFWRLRTLLKFANVFKIDSTGDLRIQSPRLRTIWKRYASHDKSEKDLVGYWYLFQRGRDPFKPRCMVLSKLAFKSRQDDSNISYKGINGYWSSERQTEIGGEITSEAFETLWQQSCINPSISLEASNNLIIKSHKKTTTWLRKSSSKNNETDLSGIWGLADDKFNNLSCDITESYIFVCSGLHHTVMTLTNDPGWTCNLDLRAYEASKSSLMGRILESPHAIRLDHTGNLRIHRENVLSTWVRRA